MSTTKTNNAVWYVYIVACADNSLYTGITTDIYRRIKEHNSTENGAKYTKSRRPVSLVYQEQVESRSKAARREYEIRQLSAKAKKQLFLPQAAPHV